MSEKTLKSRIVHKHDIEANWLKATNFIPKQGEIIVYDVDANYNYERMKIGDGKTVVSSLPFTDDSVTDLFELVGDTSVAEQISNAISEIPQSNWNQSDKDSADYIKNRTHYVKSTEEVGDMVDVTVTGFEEFDGTYSGAIDIEIPEFSQFIYTFKVIWDGTEYLCERISESVVRYLMRATLTLGNQGILGEGEDTGEPFFMYIDEYNGSISITTTDAGTQHTIKIVAIYEDIQPLSGKYIPREIARTTDVENLVFDMVGDYPVSMQIEEAVDGLATEDYVNKKLEDLEVGNVDSATKATQDASGNVITTTYETKTDATSKLNAAKAYADEKISAITPASIGAATVKSVSDLDAKIGDDSVASQINAAVSGKANTSDLTSHTGNTTVHISSAERTKWNTHADSAHAPSNAQANVIESIKVNGTAQTITSKSVNITVPTDNKDLANGAGYLVSSDIANKADKATTLAGYGITDAAAKSHGTHVTWSTTTPKANGTAAVGSETKVARGDHVHPTDTTRAAASDVEALQELVGDTAVATQISNAVANKVDKVSGKGLSTNDLTATLKSNYDAAYTHSVVTTGNPHKVTKSDVGLGNVENKSSATIRGEITSSNVTTALGYTPSKNDHTHSYIPMSEKGVASGVATLDTTGKVPSSQLPSYVDDVIEGYYLSGKFYKTNSTSGTVITGETGKIYVDLGARKTYRWSGSSYAVISETLSLGETSSTAYAGDKGAANANAIVVLEEKVGEDSVANQIDNAIVNHTHTVSHTPAGTVVSKSITPAGTVSQPTFTGSAVTSGESSAKTTVYSITDVGTLPSHTYTAPSLTASCENQCLTLTFNAGSHSFNAGILPTKGSGVSVATGTHTHSVTAAGTVSQPTFTGTAASHDHAFTGTKADLTTSVGN